MTEEQMRVLRMIEEGKISAEDGAKLLGVLNAAGRPTAPTPPTGPLPPVPPLPPIPPIPPGLTGRAREQAERERERAERERERALREAERERERALREAERERERRERGRERGRARVSIGDDVFWGRPGRRDPRDTGPLGEGGGGGRWFRVRVTDVRSGQVKVNVSLPMGLINFGLKLGAKYIPENAGFDIEEIRQAVRGGMTGKIIEVEDTEDGERVEVFVE
jgi:hypothetical protein